MNFRIGKLKKWDVPWLALGCFVLGILIIQPIRETGIDDDWAYAWTVKHLIDTGHYQLNDWLAANMPFQAYWGLLFTKIFGYSFSSLRMSTLVLSLIGLLAFYRLARELRFGDTEAGLLTLLLVSSPLAQRYSFTFMTDVPFLMTVVISLLLYALAIKRETFALMFAASVAASAAILVRQFGVALIAGLAALWLVDGRCRRQPLLFATGCALPLMAAAWQAREGMANPNWAAMVVKFAQKEFLSNPRRLISAMIWRPAIIMQYMALFCIPLASLPMIAHYELLLARKPNLRRWAEYIFSGLALLGIAMIVLALAWAAFAHTRGMGAIRSRTLMVGFSFILIGLCARLLGSQPADIASGDASPRQARAWLMLLPTLLIALYVFYGTMQQGKWLMPYLPWSFGELARYGYWSLVPITLFTFWGGVIFSRKFIDRYLDRWGALAPAEKFVDLTSLFLVMAHLVFYKMGDQYLLDLMPITLIAVGRQLSAELLKYRRTAAGLCMVCACFWANDTRAWLAQAEAHWKLAESVHAKGGDPRNTFGSWTWVSYHRFHDYVADIHGRSVENFDDFFFRWLPDQRMLAKYVTENGPVPAENLEGEIIGQVFYRDISFNRRVVDLIEKKGPASP